MRVARVCRAAVRDRAAREPLVRAGRAARQRHRVAGRGGARRGLSPSLTEEQRRRVMARVGPRLTAVAQDTRSQARNRELALERLRSRLAAALSVQRPRRATKPSREAAPQASRVEAPPERNQAPAPPPERRRLRADSGPELRCRRRCPPRAPAPALGVTGSVPGVSSRGRRRRRDGVRAAAGRSGPAWSWCSCRCRWSGRCRRGCSARSAACSGRCRCWTSSRRRRPRRRPARSRQPETLRPRMPRRAAAACRRIRAPAVPQ